MAARTKVTFFLKIDADSNWVVDEGHVIDEKWNDQIGSGEVGPTAVYKFTVNLPQPAAREVEVFVPDAPNEQVSVKVEESSP